MFSKACEYGIKSAIYIAQQSNLGRKISLIEASEAIDSPTAYTSKILQQLVKAQIIKSDKGPRGGFSMLAKTEKPTLIEIVTAIDGNKIFENCGLGLRSCNNEMPCPVHHKFKLIRDTLKQMLETTTIDDLAANFSNGLSILKR